MKFYLEAASIRQDRAIAERPRPEFGSALQYSHHLLFSEGSSNVGISLRAHQLTVRQVIFIQKFSRQLRCEARTEQRPMHGVRRVWGACVTKHLVPDVPGRPEGAACIACRGLDPHIVEDSTSQYLAVRDAIQGHASCKTEIRLSGNRPRVASDLEHDFVGYLLDRRRE